MPEQIESDSFTINALRIQLQLAQDELESRRSSMERMREYIGELKAELEHLREQPAVRFTRGY